ncbi:neprilysin-1-like [Dermacentor albipictus]|uniref:neprilysin-1-like n=1 Tax=Dermacentor albipictus TaxID=60249 RepID=UPI0038FCC59E
MEARESLNLLHRGFKPSLHLAKRRGTHETETTSKLNMKNFQHQDEIASGRTFLESIGQKARTVTRRVLQVSAACAVLVMGLLLTITAYLFLSTTLWTPLKYCDSPHCADLAKRLADWINTSVDPCDDFYSFVCGLVPTDTGDHMDVQPSGGSTNAAKRGPPINVLQQDAIASEQPAKKHLKIMEASSKVNHAILMELERSFTEAILSTSHEQSWLTLNQLNHSWTSDDWAVLEDANALTNIDKLFEKHNREHLLIGIAWLFIQSHLWAVTGEPELMFRNDIDEKKKHACLEYVNSRLGLLTSAEHLTQLFPTSESRQEVSDFLLSLKSELKSLAENARWIDLETREMAKRKIDRVDLNVLPAEKFFAPLQRALLYEAFPSMNDSVFFESWLKASSTYQALQSHKNFRDVYSKRRVCGQEPLSYNYLLSVVDAAMVALEPPRYYVGAPFAFNYAGAGTLFALEISKSFDELGTTVDSRGETVHWWGRARSANYDRRLSCDLGKHVTIPLIPAIPALEASYSAYKTAVSREAGSRGVKDELRVRGLDTYSEEALFFMTYCYALCGGKGSTRLQEKCNVPLRHSS